MIVEIKVPELGESINEVEIGEWLVQIGDTVHADEEIVAIESDKATVEVPAPAAGVLVKILKEQGAKAVIGEVVGHIDTAQGGQKEMRTTTGEGGRQDARTDSATKREEAPAKSAARVMPAAARILAQHNIAADTVTPTGPGERILKEDARRAVTEVASPEKIREEQQPPSSGLSEEVEAAKERRVPMTPIRRTIAARLLEAKHTMALLTTFNEVDMSEVKRVRSLFGQQFADKFGVKLGFMSFFIKAVVTALGDFPLVNAAIDGRDIVYHDSCDIGVAIGGGKGLVVPVLRSAERMGFAEIEKKIAEFAEKARNNSLTIEELTGGTFTISNGGVYGSMLSTPIVNPPQSAILGLHAIQDRPVAIGGEVRIRPIMYLACNL